MPSLHSARSSLSFHSIGELHIQKVGLVFISTTRAHNIAKCLASSTLRACLDAVASSVLINLPCKRVISCYRTSDGLIDHHVFHEPSLQCAASPAKGNYLFFLWRHLTSSAKQCTLLARSSPSTTSLVAPDSASHLQGISSTNKVGPLVVHQCPLHWFPPLRLPYCCLLESQLEVAPLRVLLSIHNPRIPHFCTLGDPSHHHGAPPMVGLILTPSSIVSLAILQ